VQVITDETFTKHQGFDLATFEDRTYPPSELHSFRVLKSQPFVDFKRSIVEQLGVRPSDARLWVLVNRQNKTVRPDAPVPENDPTLSM
jgi:ubiquitin carboxyl-terminal hydrolase 7